MLADAAADGRAAVGGGYATGSAEPYFVASGGERWRAVASGGERLTSGRFRYSQSLAECRARSCRLDALHGPTGFRRIAVGGQRFPSPVR